MRIALLWTMVLVVSAGWAAEDRMNSPLPEPVGRFPFDLARNRVVLPVRIGGAEPLDVILDTGMGFDGVYLFHRELIERIGGEEFIEVRVPGAGSGEASTALMADSATISCGDVVFENQRVIVSTSGATQGFPTDGVIGWTLLGHHAVEIDYDEERVTLHEPGGWSPDSSWERLDLTLTKNIPWILAAVAVEDAEPVSSDVYIDLAAGEAIEILVRPEMKFPVPVGLEEKYVGTGLSGDIHGGIGRVARIRIGSFELRDVLAAFVPAEVRSKQEGADAVLGGDLLRRFNVVFDYAGGALFLKPSRHYAEPFGE
ncbi:MAG: aspartyl protease family protein [Candidatus Eisenbacteria bacterium]